MILTKLDQHVNEMMTTAGKKFKNFVWSRFLIIVQHVKMVTNGKRNSRLNPNITSLSYNYVQPEEPTFTSHDSGATQWLGNKPKRCVVDLSAVGRVD